MNLPNNAKNKTPLCGKEIIMKYQIVKLAKAETGKKTRIATVVAEIESESLKAAYATIADDKGKVDADMRIYPLATPTDGDSVYSLADYALYSYEKWERRNEHACENPRKRKPEDREDYRQDGAVAILAKFAEDAKTNMHECKKSAFSEIAKKQKRHERNSEREYNPNFASCNGRVRAIADTFPELSLLVKKSIKAAKLTEEQMTAVEAIEQGYNIAEYARMIAERDGRKAETVRRLLYTTAKAANKKILETMLALDNVTRDAKTKKLVIPEESAFARAKIGADDIDAVLTKITKQAKK